MISSLRRRRPPRLSVVVPVYNVEPYLADCLDSILAQTFGDIEVILVDDGSTDSSAAIAARYADRHPTWLLVRTENHGLGAARNRGVEEARAEYLAFVDSDDLLPDYAYELMISTLDESGSDFVVGSVQQLFEADGNRPSRLVEPDFIRAGVAQRRLGVQAADVPPIIRNVFAWNKVFRRSFYDRAEIRFPEGVRYEDQPATMRAYLSADRFDIVRRPVYSWRIRADSSSITQRRGDLADLEDRLMTKRLTTEVVRSLGVDEIIDYWGRLALVGDLPVYFQQIPAADEAFWDRLVVGLRELLSGFPPIERSMLRLPYRLIGWLVAQNRRVDAERVLHWLDANPGPLSLRVERDHVVADLPVASDDDSDVPDDARWLGEHELEFDARLLAAHWEGTALVVRGWAVIRGATTQGVQTAVRAWLRSDTPGAVASVPADVERFPAPDATRWVDRGDQRYDDSGFVARFELATWSERPRAERAELSLDLELDVAWIHRRGRLRTRSSESATTPERPAFFADLDWRPGEGLFVVPR